MFKARILNIVLSMALLLCITGCISNTDMVESKSYPLAVSVSDFGFTSASGTKATTRATESGYVTTFAKGDQIGLYVVNSSNNVETANLCLTYNGTNWNYPTGSMVYYNSTSRYFAYYPYQSTLTGAPTTSTATDAATFFATAISDWTPATDQSSQAKYTASDLMVGTGIAGTLYSNATRAMSFNMSHQMALVDMNFPYYYLSTDNNYTYTLGLTCNGFKPYHVSNGNYRYIIKSATNTSIWGYYCTTTSANTNQIFNKAVKAAAGTYQTMNVDNTSTSTSYTMSIGDYYLNDGSVIPNATKNTYLLSKAIGVVFDTSTSTTDQGHGWTHGYVMSLTNASTSASWDTSADIDEAGDTFGSFTYKDYSGDNASYTVYITNKDGYSETKAINNIRYTSLQSNYQAFYYALNYGTSSIGGTQYVAPPNNNSGWFLPSIGQWYDIYTNLGKMSTTPVSYSTGTCNWLNTNSSGTSLCAGNINAYMANASSIVTTDYFLKNSSISAEWYWSSTEYNGSNSYYADLYNNGYTWLAENGNLKSVTRTIRSAIAF